MALGLYFICFIIFSFLGWIYESIYCTIRTHHWDNRGSYLDLFVRYMEQGQ